MLHRLNVSRPTQSLYAQKVMYVEAVRIQPLLVWRKKGRGRTWSSLGRQLLPPAPNQGHYNNHPYEGDGEDRGLRRTSAVLGKRQKGSAGGHGERGVVRENKTIKESDE